MGSERRGIDFAAAVAEVLALRCRHVKLAAESGAIEKLMITVLAGVLEGTPQGVIEGTLGGTQGTLGDTRGYSGGALERSSQWGVSLMKLLQMLSKRVTRTLCTYVT